MTKPCKTLESSTGSVVSDVNIYYSIYVVLTCMCLWQWLSHYNYGTSLGTSLLGKGPVTRVAEGHSNHSGCREFLHLSFAKAGRCCDSGTLILDQRCRKSVDTKASRRTGDQPSSSWSSWITPNSVEFPLSVVATCGKCTCMFEMQQSVHTMHTAFALEIWASSLSRLLEIAWSNTVVTCSTHAQHLQNVCYGCSMQYLRWGVMQTPSQTTWELLLSQIRLRSW